MYVCIHLSSVYLCVCFFNHCCLFFSVTLPFPLLPPPSLGILILKPHCAVRTPNKWSVFVCVCVCVCVCVWWDLEANLLVMEILICEPKQINERILCVRVFVCVCVVFLHSM